MLAVACRMSWSWSSPRTERVGVRPVVLVVLPSNLSSWSGVEVVDWSKGSADLAALPPVSAGMSPVGRAWGACLSRGLPDAMAWESPVEGCCGPAWGRR